MSTNFPRWLLAIGILAALVVVVGGTILVYALTTVHLMRAEDELQTRTEIQARAASAISIVAASIDNIRIVARQPQVTRLLSTNDRAEAAEIEAWLLGIAGLEPDYLHIRLIGADGHEAIRVNRDGAELRIAATEELQDKSDRYYVQETLRLPAGEVFLSPVDLNIEQGSIEEPWRPVFRVGTPVVDDRAVVGMVIANVEAKHVLSIATAGSADTGQRLVLNNDGYVLAGRAADASWGFMFGRPPGFPQQHRHAWSVMSGRDTGQFQHGQQVYTFAAVTPSIAATTASVDPRARWRLYVVDIRRTPQVADLLTTPPAVAFGILLLAAMAWASWRGATVVHARNTAVRRRVVAEHSANRLESVLNTAVDGLIVIDSQGRMQSFNPACERIFGYTVEEVLGRDISMLMPEPYRGAHHGYLAAYQSGGAPKVIGIGREVSGRRKSGEEFPLELAVGEFDDDHGKSYVGVVRDISERRAMAAKIEAQHQDLLRSNNDLEQFAYVASHDLKSPLRGIASVATWLREDLADVLDDQQRRLLDMVEERVRRMGGLLDGILAYSRAARETHAVERIDPAAVVAEIRRLGIVPDRFRLEIDTNMPMLTGEYAPFRQVLQNLIINAIKHHDRDTGVIAVRARVNGTMARFEVEDDGPGISPRHRQRIFRMFEKLARKDRGEGSGIGLALVKKLVERNGGRIDVNPAPGGTGSVFSFDWPIGTTGALGDLDNAA